jgi:hypothetical protein
METYSLRVILGDPTKAPLWEWTQWSKIVPLIDPLVKAARAPAAVKSNQYQPDRRTPVKLGRLGWNDKSHHRWTHRSPDSQEDKSSWLLLSTDIWAPSREQCTRENGLPDFLCALQNEAFEGGNVKFNPVFLLAMKSDLAARMSTDIQKVTDGLRELTAPILMAKQDSRPWARPYPGGKGATFDSIGDMVNMSPFKAGPRHQHPPDLSIFSDTWASY